MYLFPVFCSIGWSQPLKQGPKTLPNIPLLLIFLLISILTYFFFNSTFFFLVPAYQSSRLSFYEEILKRKGDTRQSKKMRKYLCKKNNLILQYSKKNTVDCYIQKAISNQQHQIQTLHSSLTLIYNKDKRATMQITNVLLV